MISCGRTSASPSLRSQVRGSCPIVSSIDDRIIGRDTPFHRRWGNGVSLRRSYSPRAEALLANEVQAYQRTHSPMTNFLQEQEATLKFCLSFSDRRVRDIAWVLASPTLFLGSPDVPVIANDGGLLPPECLQWLRSCDEEPTAVHRWFESKRFSSRLGSYFSDCFEYYLLHSPHHALQGLRVSVPIRSFSDVKKSTIGEFDVIFKKIDDPSTYHHVELSVQYMMDVKSYKEDVAEFDLERFSGPHVTETLQTKADRWRRQLLLSEVPEASLQAFGASVGDPRVKVAPSCLLRGYLFYPWRDWLLYEENKEGVISDFVCKLMSRTTGTAKTHGLSINPEHLKGWWTDTPEELVEQKPDSWWYVPSRKEWLAPISFHRAENIAALLTGPQLLEYLAFAQDDARSSGWFRGQRILIVELIEEDGSRYTHREASRGFVVERDWQSLLH